MEWDIQLHVVNELMRLNISIIAPDTDWLASSSLNSVKVLMDPQLVSPTSTLSLIFSHASKMIFLSRRGALFSNAWVVKRLEEDAKGQ